MMNCHELHGELQDYLDDALTAERRAAVERHLGDCARCRHELDQWTALRAALRSLPVPEPRAGWAHDALMRVRQATEPRPWSRAVVGAVLAVGVVLGIAIAIIRTGERQTASLSSEQADRLATPSAQTVTLTLEHPETVRLAFNAVHPIEGVTVSLALPQSVELIGYGKRRRLSWRTDLHQGENLLALPLVAHGLPPGQLVASLSDGDQSKTFRVTIRVKRTGA